ncbi:MAG: hypothetical protein KGM98_02670 [Bacteroidota bacterium]|nr:hypothetical protein [Bacteroidota bacterium]
MNILITDSDAATYIETRDKLLWWLYIRRSILISIILLTAGIALLTDGIFRGSENKVSNYEHSSYPTTRIIKTTQVYDYHLSYGFGMALIFVSLYFFFMIFRQRMFFFKTSKRISKIRKVADNDFTIRINDQDISYQDFELASEAKWSHFSRFKIYKQFILLFADRYSWSSFAIPVNLLTDDDFKELFQFLKRRLSEKKG